MTLFIDLDGVMADFDGHHIATIGPLPPRYGRNGDDHTSADSKDIDWKKIESVQFYLHLPMMADAQELWDYVKKHNPPILTGVPSTGRETAERNKRSWVTRNLGPHVPVITCLSREKAHYCQPGDVLVDDWIKYRPNWHAAGGHFVVHTSALSSIAELRKLGL